MAFETAQLTDINFKLDQIGADANIRKQYQPQIAGLMLIKNRQTASLNEPLQKLLDNTQNLDGKVFVNWITTDNVVAEDIEPNCTLDGPLLDSARLPYSLTMNKKTDFSINVDEAKNHIFSVEEQVATGFLKMFKVLDEYYATQVIAKADAYAGVNQFLGTGMTNSGGATQVPAAQYNVALFPYLAQAAIINRFSDYYLIDNGSLFTDKFLADAGQVQNGISNANIYSQFDIDFDLINFAKASIPTDTLLINRDSLFFATKTRFSNPTPERRLNQYVYTRTSPFTNITYDVYYEEKCIVPASSNREQIVQTFRMQTQGDLLRSPELTAFPSVVAFDKVAA